MWGSSPTDVWGVAGDGASPSDALWHFDGNAWRRATAGTIFTNWTGNRFVYDIWGTSHSSIWAVGRLLTGNDSLTAMIVHFDGNTWQDVTPPTVAAIHGHLYTMTGLAADDIWAGGYEYAVHYDGTSWQTFLVADSMIVASITGSANHIYAAAYSPWGRNALQLYRLIGDHFALTDQTTLYHSKFGKTLWLRNNRLLAMGYGIYSTELLQDGSVDTAAWHLEFDTGTKGIATAFVQSMDNAFAIGSVYLVCHFNGRNWQEIDIRVPNDPGNILSSLFAGWTDGSEVFVANGHDGIIYHGR